jgi:putative flippase GtrA
VPEKNLKGMIDTQFVWKFFKFGVVGFSGVFVDFGVTWLLKERFQLNKYVANSAGFICAVFSNYFLNRMWTFEDHNPDILLQFTKFLFIAMLGLLINNFIIFQLTEKKQRMHFYVAKAIATGIVTFWNFFGNYLFTFAGN